MKASYIQPDWVCYSCGDKFRSKPRDENQLSTIHMGTCGVCKEEKPVTEPRDFGYLVPAWNINDNTN